MSTLSSRLPSTTPPLFHPSNKLTNLSSDHQSILLDNLLRHSSSSSSSSPSFSSPSSLSSRPLPSSSKRSSPSNINYQPPLPPSDNDRMQTTNNVPASQPSIMGSLIKGVCVFFLIITCPLSIFSVIKIVQEYERAIIFRLGRVLSNPKGPGMFAIIPCIDKFVKVDLRTISFDVPPQEILTKDSVTIAVDAVVYYRVSNPMIAVCNIENAARSTQLLSQTTLRNMLGMRTLAEILQDRDTISHQMQSALDAGTDPWGVLVERVEIKDVRLPMQMQRSMAAEAEATREAKAKIISADGELQASKALREASDVMAGSPSALQLRYLQTLNTIASEQNSTIVFPLPMELLKPFLGKKD